MSARRATACSRRAERKSSSTRVPASNVHTRARICEAGEKAAIASGAPSWEHTWTVSPLAGVPSTRSTAPEKIQGWRWRRDFSLPGLRTRRAEAFMGDDLTRIRRPTQRRRAAQSYQANTKDPCPRLARHLPPPGREADDGDGA